MGTPASMRGRMMSKTVVLKNSAHAGTPMISRAADAPDEGHRPRQRGHAVEGVRKPRLGEALAGEVVGIDGHARRGDDEVRPGLKQAAHALNDEIRVVRGEERLDHFAVVLLRLLGDDGRETILNQPLKHFGPGYEDADFGLAHGHDLEQRAVFQNRKRLEESGAGQEQRDGPASCKPRPRR